MVLRAAMITRRDVLALALGLAAGPANAEEGPPPLYSVRHQFVENDPGPQMAPLRLSQLTGKPALLEAPRAGALLINVWATWCPACRTELPQLARLAERLGGAGLRIAAIATDAAPVETVARYVRGLDTGHVAFYADPSATALNAGSRSPFAVPGMPTSFVVDASGRVRGYLQGATDWSGADADALLRFFLRA